MVVLSATRFYFTLWCLIFLSFQLSYSKQLLQVKQDTIIQTQETKENINSDFISTQDKQNSINDFTAQTITKQNSLAQTYSIIHDLRIAFEPYSTLDIKYKDILQAYNKEEKDSIRLLPYNYTSFLELLDTTCCSMPRYAINSFDLKDKTKDLQQLLETFHNTTKQDTTQTIQEITKNPNQTAQEPKQAKSINIDIKTLAPKCLHKKFHIVKDEKLQIHTLLYALAKECDFSIQYTHNGKQVLHNHQSMALYIKNKPLDFVLSMLLSDMFYTIDSHRLIISDISMQMFAINYISSTRMAQSSTDVLFAQEQQDNYNMGYSGGFYNNTYSSIPSWQTQNTQTPYNYTQSMSGYLDNLSLRNQLRTQMSVANSRFGKSGTKVYSLDEINFWADIESKLHIMLDTKLGDKFMIDKGAGLIAVWTTKQKMQEVSQFLQSLEHKMNMQVAIDVEILSLTHYQTNSIGIDWQAIFSILNPTQSNLNLSFGSSGAMLTLGNNNADLQSIFNLLRTYGDLRSLSNPKIMALNNQPALISVGSVLRYTQNLVYQSNNTNTTIQNTSTQYPSVFAGILLDITPSISEDSVILRINPSITKTKDPDMENAAQALNAPPNLSTNQLSSIVKLKDGERVIIGGLLSNVVQNTTQAIPKIGETRGLRHIFGKQSKAQRSEELIIIITPHIIR